MELKLLSSIKAMPRKFKGLSKKKKIWIILGLLAVIAAIFFGLNLGKNKNEFVVVGTEGKVEKLDITSSITGSAVVQPKDQYSITALVSGDVISANFEQGDIVQEGDILYQIDSSDAQTTIENANISYQRSQMDYNKAVDKYNNLTVRSDISGVVRDIYVKEGAFVNNGAKIADIYDDSYFTLTLTFHDIDAENIYVGQTADVRISSNGEIIPGTVLDVNTQGYAAEGNTMVRTVKIKVKNPGVLTNAESATAIIGGFTSSSSGKFEYISEKTITAEVSGDVSTVYVSRGSRVSAGTNLIKMESDDIKDSLTSSELSLRSSQLSRQNAQDRLDDYTITAPISGTVVEKNVKAGDKLDNSNMQTEMAVIYDMSSLECELSVDELDIKNVEIGQDVTITSDAIEGKRYNGIVTNISVNGTTSGGVTTYPVTVVITDFDEDLLPGMNIDVEIITSKAQNVLAVPVSAVNRGNVVYVKGEKTDDKDMAPEGFYSVRVETGAYNKQYIEIKSGLSEGDVVYIPQVQSTGTGGGIMGMHAGMFGGGGMPSGGMSGARMPGGGMSGGMSGGRSMR
ncbi:MAG: HlyD family efflux transporter periplasmic adaptor subunit [Clostridia bacterium]|nr:HlyD family efflux transporter periplasmic adaptor subunit [Clostridia bacterium]